MNELFKVNSNLSQPIYPSLFYIVGGSGSGKDSIIEYCRENIFNLLEVPIIVAHRYITRTGQQGENSICLSAQEFDERLENHLFALAWRANGLSYGIGIELDFWLKEQFIVIVNGSREYLPKAEIKYGKALHSIEVTVPIEELEKRLINRNRENTNDIQARLKRHSDLSKKITTTSFISNTGSIETAAKKLGAIITSHALLPNQQI